MPILEKPSSSRPAIPHNPLPQAGESLRRQFNKVADEEWNTSLLMIFLLILITGWEWIRYLFDIRPTLPHTIILSVVAVGYALFFLRKMRRAGKILRDIDLGIIGEKTIGQYLDTQCPPLHYRVFHDIPCSGPSGPFNIDHALIGPAGIFAIETKNWSLPPKGTKAKIRFHPESNTLIKPDGTFNTEAPAQALANADYLRKLLAQLTARPEKSLHVKPVLLLPGWWIEDPTPNPRPLWIFGKDTLHKWLKNEPGRLSDDDISLFTESLATHIRNAPT